MSGPVPAPEVTCATHGPMKYRLGLNGWDCCGFDGEGCARWLSAEAVVKLAYGGGPVGAEFTPLTWQYDVSTGRLVKVELDPR